MAQVKVIIGTSVAEVGADGQVDVAAVLAEAIGISTNLVVLESVVIIHNMDEGTPTYQYPVNIRVSFRIGKDGSFLMATLSIKE